MSFEVIHFREDSVNLGTPTYTDNAKVYAVQSSRNKLLGTAELCVTLQ